MNSPTEHLPTSSRTRSATSLVQETPPPVAVDPSDSTTSRRHELAHPSSLGGRSSLYILLGFTYGHIISVDLECILDLTPDLIIRRPHVMSLGYPAKTARRSAVYSPVIVCTTGYVQE